MSGLVNELVDILAQQTEHFHELLGLSEEKKTAIVKNEIPEIQKITDLENIIISQNQKLENQRQEVVRKISKVLSIDPDHLQMELLLDVVKDFPEHDALKKQATELRAVLDKLKTLNDLNRELIQHSLDYIDFSVNLIRSAMSEEPLLYSKDGSEMESDKGFFDARQ